MIANGDEWGHVPTEQEVYYKAYIDKLQKRCRECQHENDALTLAIKEEEFYRKHNKSVQNAWEKYIIVLQLAKRRNNESL